MNHEALSRFEEIVRNTLPPEKSETPDHPFEVRGYAALFPDIVRQLFDDGHYSQATFEGYKVIEEILRVKADHPTGFGVLLINYALEGKDPRVKIASPPGESYDKFRDNLQKMMAGAFGNIRNPKGHKLVDQGLDDCLDELTMAAYFIRLIDPPVSAAEITE